MDIEQLQGLQGALALDPRLLPQRPTFVANLGREVAGFYQLRLDRGAPRFERFWVRPARASLGVAALMWGHACEFAKREGIGDLDANRLKPGQR